MLITVLNVSDANALNWTAVAVSIDPGPQQ
jgi:hypothetical protein